MLRTRGRRVRGAHGVTDGGGEAVATRPSVGRLGWCAVLISICVPFVSAVILAVTYHPVTQYDEQAHFDYVARLATEHSLFPVGSVYSDAAIEEMRCRGIGLTASGQERSTCGPRLSAAELPFRGVNYVAGYSPLFYTATALIAGPVSSTDTVSLFLASRLVCAVWFALGGGVLTLALIRLGVRPLLAAAATLLLASTPSFLLQGGTVTPDSFSLLAGAGTLLILTLRTSWRRRMAWAVGFAIVTALVKSSFIPLATFTVLLAAVFPTSPGGRARWIDLGWRRLLAAVALATLPVLAQGANSLWRSASLRPGTTADGGMNDILHTSSSLWTEIVLGAIELLHPLDSVGYVDPPSWVVIAVLLQTVLIGGTAVVAMYPHLSVRGAARTMAFGAIGAWLLAVLFLPVTFYVMFHVQGTQGRYALPIVPLFLAAVVLAVKDGKRVGLFTALAAAVAWTAAIVAVVSV